MFKESNSIRSVKIKRDLQFIAFIITGIIGLGVILLTIFDLLPVMTLFSLIPFALMMKRNVQMWDLYNDVFILRKCLTDKDYLNKILNESKDENRTNDSK